MIQLMFPKQSHMFIKQNTQSLTRCSLHKHIHSSYEHDKYNNKLQKKYKIQNMLNYYDKVISYKYSVALKICDKNKPISKQPQCKKVWKELESIAILKSAVEQSLIDLDDWLSSNK